LVCRPAHLARFDFQKSIDPFRLLHDAVESVVSVLLVVFALGVAIDRSTKILDAVVLQLLTDLADDFFVSALSGSARVDFQVVGGHTGNVSFL